MTIHRDETGEIIFECNGCEDNLETLSRDFQSALAEMRESGWRAKKAGAEWEHECPSCQDEDGGMEFEDVS